MQEKNIHLITTYEAIFNEDNATCALSIDMQKFNIDCLKDTEIVFSIDYEKSNIRVESEKDLFIFLNADKELIYYASKTDKLAILFGTTEPPQLIGALFAELKDI